MTPERIHDTKQGIYDLCAALERMPDDPWYFELMDYLVLFYGTIVRQGVGEVGSVHAGHSQVTRHNALFGTDPDSRGRRT